MKVAQPYVPQRPVVFVAAQVTVENMTHITKWCGGHLLATDASGTPEIYIRVPVHQNNPIDHGKPKRAFVGDYVVLDADGFKIYRASFFESRFKSLDKPAYDEILDNLNLHTDF